MDMAKLITQNEVKCSFSDHVCLYNKLMITMNSVFMMRYKLTVIEISFIQYITNQKCLFLKVIPFKSILLYMANLTQDIIEH